MQSQPSNTASQTTGSESSSPHSPELVAANARLLAKRPKIVPSLGESTRNLTGRFRVCSPAEEAEAMRLRAEQAERDERDRVSQLAEREQRRLAAIEDRYAASGIPMKHRIEPDHDRCPAWAQACSRVLDHLGDGALLALVGNRGTGKTQIAERAIRFASSQPHSLGDGPAYVRAMSFFLRVKATFQRDAGETEDRVIGDLRLRSLLVIDEMHERGSSEWEDRLLTHVIDLRYGDGRDTILIANLSPEAFTASVGPSIADRIRETGGLIECTWPSFRDKANP